MIFDKGVKNIGEHQHVEKLGCHDADCFLG